MDIVRIVKSFHVRASYATLALKHKFFLLLFLVSLVPTLLPHETQAAFLITKDYKPVLVFDTTNGDYRDYLIQLGQEATDQYYQQQLEAHVQQQLLLTKKVEDYLAEQRSPLADYAGTLITLRNWKKIVALANAESTLCRNYPTGKANCWGVGGANLWDMGDDLGQGIVSMNHFLNQYPRGSTTKYSQMGFDRMNGLYKQPAAEHWLYNAESVYDELSTIEKSI